MDNNPPISADELQIEFDRLKEVFRGDNSFAKFEASAEMMVLISRYLSNNIQSIDVEHNVDVKSPKKQVQLMRVLVTGCKKHPVYRATRPITGNCEPCVKMWKARLALEKFDNRFHH